MSLGPNLTDAVSLCSWQAVPLELPAAWGGAED